MQQNSKQHSPDIILRSSDAQTFQSWKMLLAISSPVFKDMFSLSQPDTSDSVEGNDEHSVIDLPEDGLTLGHLLSLCHPPSCAVQPFKVNSIAELGAVLDAAAKYDMQSILRVALNELANPLFLHSDPLRIYALACQYECHDTARLAAKQTLMLPELVREYSPELEKIHAGKLCRLLLYRQACSRAILPVVDCHGWIVPAGFSPLFWCSGGTDMGRTTIRHSPSRKYPRGRLEEIPVHRWWLEYMRKARIALQGSICGDAVKDKKLVDGVQSEISSSECEECDGLQVSRAFQSFVDAFAEKIDSCIAEVHFNFGAETSQWSWD